MMTLFTKLEPNLKLNYQIVERNTSLRRDLNMAYKLRHSYWFAILCFLLMLIPIHTSYAETLNQANDKGKNEASIYNRPIIFKTGYWGFIDRSGKKVFNSNFFGLGKFSEGLAAASTVMLSDQSLRFGYIDYTGKFVIPQNYTAALDFSEGLAAVRIDITSGWGFIDKSGELVIPYKRFLGDVSPFSEGLAAFKDWSIGKSGFIDKQGNVAIPAEYDEVRSFSNGLALVKKTGKDLTDQYFYIDRTGKIIITVPKNTLPESFSEGLALVDTQGPGFYFMDLTGKKVFQTNDYWIYGSKFSEGYFAFDPDLSGKIGFIDHTGKIAIKPIFTRGGVNIDEGFSNGLAPVEINGKVGYINKLGKMIIKPQFNYGYKFQDGIAEVGIHEGNATVQGFIDLTGKIIFKNK